MSTPPEASHDLSDFAELLAAADREGFEFVVIGGCAVGAYARLLDVVSLSSDLDLYVTRPTLDRMVNWARRQGAEVLALPRPRALQVAPLRWRDGKRFDLLTEAPCLPSPETLLRGAREVTLASHGLEVPIIDPYDLLANTLAVRRPKDEPHIDILCRFIEEEVVAAFRDETSGRRQIAPARRYLDALGRETLPDTLAARLVEAAEHPAAFRFLAGRITDAVLAPRLTRRAVERGAGPDVIDIVVERFVG